MPTKTSTPTTATAIISVRRRKRGRGMERLAGDRPDPRRSMPASIRRPSRPSIGCHPCVSGVGLWHDFRFHAQCARLTPVRTHHITESPPVPPSTQPVRTEDRHVARLVLKNFGIKMAEQPFKELLADTMHAFYRAIESIDELLVRPREAIRYCD